MIKKFEEYISEGFWKDSIKRAKDNTERLEDRLDSNVYDLKEVDLDDRLGFYVADNLLRIGDNTEFTYADFVCSPEEKQINRLGWRVPTLEDFRDMERCKLDASCSDAKCEGGKGYYHIFVLKGNKEQVKYTSDNDLLMFMSCSESITNNSNIHIYYIKRQYIKYYTAYTSTKMEDIHEKLSIMLIKDKK